jgi:hypothetical protein
MKLNLLITYAALLLLSSCFRPYYIAPVHNVPLFKEKNEIHGAISAATSSRITSENVQLAYAASNHIAVIGNYMNVNATDLVTGNAGRARYIDVGGGYYKAFEKAVVLELLGGFGHCTQNHVYDDLMRTPTGQVRATGNAQLAFNKIFFQPSVGLSTYGIDLAFTSMFSNLNYTRVNHTLDTLTRVEYNRLNELRANPNIVMFEPSVTFRFGWRFVKGQIQYTRSYILSGPFIDPYVFIPGRVSFGLYFAFAPRYLEKKTASK